MPLTLIITSYQNRSAPGNATKVIEKGSISIGRAPDNDWVLADPEMVLSRKHCSVSYQNEGYFLIDTSVNGVFLNQSEQRLGKGNTVRLNQGDEFTLGDYTLQVMISDSVKPALPDTGEFTELWDDHEPPPVVSKSTAAPAREVKNLSGEKSQVTVPQDPEPGAPVSVHTAPAQRDDILSAAAPASEDALALADSIKSTAIVDPNPDPLPLRHITSAKADVMTAPKPQFDAVEADGLNNEAISAFLRGLGIMKLPLQNDNLPELMHLLGVILRQTVDGMMDVLRARSTIKRELRIDKTMIGPVKNNPLKWQPNAEEALYALLGKRGNVWMSPDEAIREGFDDIKVHELAMNIGMQAALMRLLKTFDPNRLEQEFNHSSRFAFLAGGRQSRYWEGFKKHYYTIAEASDGEFRELLNKEISRAYENQQQHNKKPEC
jgi:type VI secretion system protein